MQAPTILSTNPIFPIFVKVKQPLADEVHHISPAHAP